MLGSSLTCCGCCSSRTVYKIPILDYDLFGSPVQQVATKLMCCANTQSRASPSFTQTYKVIRKLLAFQVSRKRVGQTKAGTLSILFLCRKHFHLTYSLEATTFSLSAWMLIWIKCWLLLLLLLLEKVNTCLIANNSIWAPKTASFR